MKKTHCNRCDRVITEDQPRLVLECNVFEGNKGVAGDDETRDFCMACVRNNEILGPIFEELRA